jgi:hypothetical protein
MIPQTKGRMLTRLATVNEQARQQFLATLISASASAHIHHLKTTSFSRHIGLDKLYSDLPGLVDALVEECLGEYGPANTYPPITVNVSPDANPLGFVEDLFDYVKTNRYEVSDESYIQNSIDAICSLLSRVKYMLRDLK